MEALTIQLPFGPMTSHTDTETGLATMRRVCIAMFLVGGLVSLLGVWITQATRQSQLEQAAVTAALVATGLALAAIRDPSRRLLESSVLWGMVLLGVLMARSQPLGMAPVFYLWPVVASAYFSSRRVLGVCVVWMTVTLATGLWLNPTHDLKADTFIGTLATVGVMAAVVAAMTRREAELRAELAAAAETDPLTGLLNRRAFNPRLDALVADAGAGPRALAVVMLDIDHFKWLNDEHGHLVGDQVLQAVGAVLHVQSRDTDVVSRFGGEEFAVALADADGDDARAYAERVAHALHQVSVPGRILPVSISAGISLRESPTDTVEALLSRADAALYAAKAAGRGRTARWERQGVRVGPPFAAAASGPTVLASVTRPRTGPRGSC